MRFFKRLRRALQFNRGRRRSMGVDISQGAATTATTTTTQHTSITQQQPTNNTSDDVLPKSEDISTDCVVNGCCDGRSLMATSREYHDVYDPLTGTTFNNDTAREE